MENLISTKQILNDEISFEEPGWMDFMPWPCLFSSLASAEIQSGRAGKKWQFPSGIACPGTVMKDVTGSSALWSFSKPCESKGWASSSINQTSPSAYSLFYDFIVLRLQFWSKKQCVLSPFSSSSSWSSSSFIYFFILPLPSPLLPLPLAFSTWEPNHNVSARWRDPSLNGFRELLTLSYSPSSWKHQGFLQEISPSTCWYLFGHHFVNLVLYQPFQRCPSPAPRTHSPVTDARGMYIKKWEERSKWHIIKCWRIEMLMCEVSLNTSPGRTVESKTFKDGKYMVYITPHPFPW